MRRHRSLVASFLLVTSIGFAVVPVEASVPSTWGRIKALYATGPDVITGPGLTPTVAQSAVRAVNRTVPGRWSGPIQVGVFGHSRLGRVLKVIGEEEGGALTVNLVTDRGRYLGGARVDPATGTLTNAATGQVLWRGDVNEIDRGGAEDILKGIAHGAGDMACAAIANAALQNCLISIGPIVGMFGAAVCFAIAAATLAACEAANHLDFYLDKGDSTDCSCPRH